MRLNDRQMELLAKYFADISKILVASTVIGFFVPMGSWPITWQIFLTGSLMAILTLGGSIALLKSISS